MKKEKSNLTKLEKFEIYSSFFISLVTLVLSCYIFYCEQIENKKENVSILGEYENNFLTEDRTLSKNISVVISNMSLLDISVTQVIVSWNGGIYTFDSNNCEDLPLNLEANHTSICNVVLDIETTNEQMELLEKIYNDVGEINDRDIRKYINVLSNDNELKITTAKGTVSEYNWRWGGRAIGHRTNMK